MAKLEYPMLPKQLEFCGAQEPEVLYSGSFGAGKTRALCTKAAMHAQIPGNRVGLCRKTLVSLKATTLKTLIDGDGEMASILPFGSFKHNKSEKTIKVYGGGEIVYFGLDQTSKIGSLNLGACGVDEAVELDEEDWKTLRSRCRNSVDPVRQLFGACNPGPPNHHLAVRFGLTEKHKAQRGCRAVETCSGDNWFLPKDYQEWLSGLTGRYGLRYRDGKWVGFDGTIYDMFTESEHVVSELPKLTSLCWITADHGTANPCVFLLIGRGIDGVYYVVDEVRWDSKARGRQKDNAEYADDMVAMIKGHNVIPQKILVDPSAADFILALRKHLHNVQGADNDVLAGIHRVMSMFRQGKLKIHARCEGLIAELLGYVWEPKAQQRGKDEPLKMTDHGPDALRYWANYILAGQNFLVTFT